MHFTEKQCSRKSKPDRPELHLGLCTDNYGTASIGNIIQKLIGSSDPRQEAVAKFVGAPSATS